MADVLPGEGARDSIVTGADADEFVRRGYLVVPELVGGADLASLQDAYDDVLSGKVTAAGDRMLGGITRQVMMPSLAHPAFDQNPALDAALSIGAHVFGRPVRRTFDMLIFKGPGFPHETPWHQDQSYAGKPVAPAGATIRNTTIQFWVAMDDADEENGCMHFVPGVHDELLEHRVASGDPDDDGRLLELVDPASQLDLAAAVAAPVKAGGATMHTEGTPHYTPPNRSATRQRRAYIFNVAPVPAR